MSLPKKDRHFVPAEVSLINLKSCLANLPASIVSSLVNANTPAQDVIVELSFSQKRTPASKASGAPGTKSAYMGWTGMSVQRKAGSSLSVNGINGSANRAFGRDRDTPIVEIDSKFGQLLGLVEGQKINLALHLDFPLAQTVSIEPLTPADWEIIELHASFLELNLLAQIRALPNPFNASSGSANDQVHPLVLHLSPTSTADVVVTSLSPTPPGNAPFAKISPDAEVIVAPKTRTRSSKYDGRDSGSVANARRGSLGASSGTSTVRQRSHRDAVSARRVVLLRGMDRGIGGNWFDEEDSTKNEGLRLWLDKDSLASKGFKDLDWVSVSVVKPSSLLEPVEPVQPSPHPKEQADSHSAKPATKVIARVYDWTGAPDGRHAAVSTFLRVSLGVQESVGFILKVEPAPLTLSAKAIKSLKFHPFGTTAELNEGLRIGGNTKLKPDLASKLGLVDEHSGDGNPGLMAGPLTDGLVLGRMSAGESQAWEGGILSFDLSPSGKQEAERTSPNWVLGWAEMQKIEVQQAIPRPVGFFKHLGPGEPIPLQSSSLVSVDKVLSALVLQLSYSSSVLLCGGMGAGKTRVAQLAVDRLRRKFLFYVSYFSCGKLVTDEIRMSTIKETLDRLFLAASWGARLGGRAVVILDDLDKLCPAETELQIGNENGRSKQVTELLCSFVKQYCGLSGGVALLATAQVKDALHNLIIKTHVVKEIVELKAPDKQERRDILEALAGQNRVQSKDVHGNESMVEREHQVAMTRRGQGGFEVEKNLDFLSIAGRTDGYMPGDLVQLMARVRSEALLRSMKSSAGAASTSPLKMTIPLGKDDFANALKGFTPVSLRNVTLHSTSTTFDSIGGLHAVRKTLLETLEYPTKYARIFAQCPLRLRSGLLLYGYPGCGKTLLASAVAGACGLNFISVKGPEMLNKYIGASEKSVRDLFARAQAARPAVLFFDEFDSIAPKRGHDSTGVTDRVVNQLLTQMDGAEGLAGVYVLAATSRPDLIDPALLRPGRLDKSLLCDLPCLDDRLDILRALCRHLSLAPDARHHGLPQLARHTEFYSGADLQAVVYNAQLHAIHDVLDDNESSSSPHHPRTKNDARLEYITFRIGDTENPPDQQQQHHQTITAQTILTKLHQSSSPHKSTTTTTTTTTPSNNNPPTTTNPLIQTTHLTRSLAQTPPSIPTHERFRLQSIYRDFVQGRRDGDMYTGEASGEVGGRSSLM